MKAWGIVRFMGSLAMLSKDNITFTDDIYKARQFASREDAMLIASSIKTPTQVQEMDFPEPIRSNFPPPDFFESVPDSMTVNQLIDLLRLEDLTEYFTPVDNITGARQMTGSAIADELTGNIVGRRYQFSFAKCLTDSAANDLAEILQADATWTGYRYIRKRAGFTSYAVLTLVRSNNPIGTNN
ncbi:hypothetical protein ST201phi2-1p312 [Pseudomonas phage 201phi2-1]|uniref:Uncharacterized protein n=1 Tax=Pseudomonas phage 201phi2-1 TaxID=198110 RepID=B3FJH2_BP201|nr:hypothetical protein ST201phi2-1p312 [Pseudomonas phage 201phi2-1]ABY63138.1 hypothetical protein 201phi2-1p312 [Pseudomonas phage 201phi2-1]